MKPTTADTRNFHKIALIGPLPPIACGVADYTSLLGVELHRSGNEVWTPKVSSYSISNAIRIVARIYQARFGVIHLQYPSAGYRKSLALHIIALLTPRRSLKVLTVHEYSQVSRPRQLLVSMLCRLCTKIIFTNKHEREFCIEAGIIHSDQSFVVPIGSNVPKPHAGIARVPKTLVYFGTIRPRKGLEEFLSAAQGISEIDPEWSFKIVCVVPDHDRKYANRILDEASRIPGLSIIESLPLQEVSNVLASSSYAYLPFPDGASERRGSLMAALECGVEVVTTEGPHTPEDLQEIVHFAADPSAAAKKLIDLEERRSTPGSPTARDRFLSEHSWPSISIRHRLIYDNVQSNGHTAPSAS